MVTCSEIKKTHGVTNKLKKKQGEWKNVCNVCISTFLRVFIKHNMYVEV